MIVAGVLVLPETISTLDLLLLGHSAYLGNEVRVQILGQLYLSAIIDNRSELEINEFLFNRTRLAILEPVSDFIVIDNLSLHRLSTFSLAER